MDIDFYQHLTLATWLFIIVYRWLHKKYSMMVVMGIAIGYEFITYFFELDNYANIQHWKLDTLLDLGAALLGCVFCILAIKDKK